MGDKSAIEWTDATWNPVRGCTRVSEGCRNCYAEIMAARFSAPGMWGHSFAEMKGGDHRWTGKVQLIESQLDLPARWKKPRGIFVNSTSDLFHEALPDEAIDRVFAVMALCPQHTFQILTKRPERMRRHLSDTRTTAIGGGDFATRVAHQQSAMGFQNVPAALRNHLPLRNVWLGVSVEDQERSDERVPLLLDTPAAVRFISAEPLLGPIDLARTSAIRSGLRVRGLPPIIDRDGAGPHLGPHLDWVIAGGESGPGARPMHPDWARGLRDQCAAASVPFFFKQWGEWHPNDHAIAGDTGHTLTGKKRAGRALDGVEHNAFPVR